MVKTIGLAVAMTAGLAMAGGEDTYNNMGCVGCHGVAGAGASAPALAGKDATYLVQQLKDFQSGARSNPTMQAMAGMVVGQEQDIADYLAGQ